MKLRALVSKEGLITEGKDYEIIGENRNIKGQNVYTFVADSLGTAFLPVEYFSVIKERVVTVVSKVNMSKYGIKIGGIYSAIELQDQEHFLFRFENKRIAFLKELFIEVVEELEVNPISTEQLYLTKEDLIKEIKLAKQKLYFYEKLRSQTDYITDSHPLKTKLKVLNDLLEKYYDAPYLDTDFN